MVLLGLDGAFVCVHLRVLLSNWWFSIFCKINGAAGLHVFRYQYYIFTMLFLFYSCACRKWQISFISKKNLPCNMYRIYYIYER